MVKKIKIGKLRLTWVFKHFWEKDRDMTTNWDVWMMRKKLSLGIWVERIRVVGPTKHGKNREETIEKTFKNSNLVNEYVIGLNFILVKTWVKFRFAPVMKLKID
jgi:hypothetical protein